jgi:O-antigen ligase
LADDVQVAFNDYLETLVETGFIGIGLLAFLIIMVLFTLRK